MSERERERETARKKKMVRKIKRIREREGGPTDPAGLFDQSTDTATLVTTCKTQAHFKDQIKQTIKTNVLGKAPMWHQATSNQDAVITQL